MRNIPTVTKNLLLINIIAFLVTLALSARGVDLNNLLGLHFFKAADFHLYQLITYMFMHGGWAHIFFNMFALWMFGCVIENTIGARRFFLYYIICGVGAGLTQELAQYIHYIAEGLASYEYVSTQMGQIPMSEFLNLWTTVGASGAIYAVLLAFGMLYPEERIFIFPLPIPIRAKWFVLFYAAIELVSAVSSSNDGVAHMAHLGGMLFGFFLLRYWRRHPDSYVRAGRSHGREFFERMKRGYERRKETGGGPSSPRKEDNVSDGAEKGVVRESEALKKARQDEVDRILDKIRKSGYDSLTKEEKSTLFKASNE